MVLVDLAIGLALISAIGLAAARPRSASSSSRRLLGWALIAVPLPAAVVLHLFASLAPTVDQAVFVAGCVLFGVGALIVLTSDGEEDWREADTEPPPWWPEFEREFRAYDRTHSRPRVPV